MATTPQDGTLVKRKDGSWARYVKGEWKTASTPGSEPTPTPVAAPTPTASGQTMVQADRPAALAAAARQSAPLRQSEPDQAGSSAETLVQTRPPAVTDVRKPKAIGPLEELEFFSLTDFRRLNADPVLASERLLDKLHLLADESLAQWSAGIAAWQKSPLFRRYQDIVRRSMTKGTTLQEEIKTDSTELTQQEFEALLDLQQKLRVVPEPQT